MITSATSKAPKCSFKRENSYNESIQEVERLYFQEHGKMPESTPELSQLMKKFKTTNQLL